LKGTFNKYIYIYIISINIFIEKKITIIDAGQPQTPTAQAQVPV